MTREVALRKVRGYLTDYFSITDYNEVEEIMLALEQQPCENCISREDAIRIAEQGQIQGYEWQFKELCNLPSVTPSIPDVENNFNIGYNCGYADAMNDIAESEG